MANLKDPQKQIPGGYSYWEPSTRFSPAPFSSLDSITSQLIEHRRSRPDLIQKNRWSLDPAQVRTEVEQYNVAVCVRNGWTDYITGSFENVGPFPQMPPSPLQRLRNVVAGEETLVEWYKEGQPLVTQEVANSRSEICLTCPRNGKGGWERFFTVPVSNAIRHELERKRNMKLETPNDEKLGTCEVCTCPIPLKLWLPLQNILDGLKPETKAQLPGHCWILK